MAVEVAEAYVSIIPSARGFGQKLAQQTDGEASSAGDSAGSRFSSGFLGHVGKLAAAAGAAIGGLAIGSLIVGSVKAASDLGESINKVNVVFGDSAPIIQNWATTAATSLGLSKQQALEAAGTFGNLFRAMGITTPVASDMSLKLIGLASDLASFNNANPNDVLLALRSGLVGEVEPLRTFGVNLNEARIKAEALSLGLVKSEVDTKKLSTAQETAEKASRKVATALKEHGDGSVEFADATRDAEQANAKLAEVMQGKVPDALDASTKAQAAYSLIMKDTALAQGDFGRTSDGLANRQRILSAQFTDIKAKVGTALLPALTSVAGFISDTMFPAISSLSDKVGPAFDSLFGKIGPLVGSIVGLGGSLKSAFSGEGFATAGGWTGVFETIGIVARQVWAIIQPVFKGLHDGLIALKAAFSGEGFATQDGIVGAFEKIGIVARQVWAILSGIDWASVFTTIIEAVRPLVEAVGGALVAAFDLLVTAGMTVFNLIQDNRATLESVAGVLKDGLAAGASAAAAAIDALSGVFNFLADHMGLVKAIVIPLVAALVAYQIVMGTIAVITGIVSAATAVWAGIQAALNVIMALNPIGLVVAAIAALVVGVIYAYTHFETFRNIVDGFWQAIQAVFNWVVSNWQLIGAVLFAPIALAVLLIVRNWDTIKGAFEAVFNFIVDHWQLILAVLTGPIGVAVAIIISQWDTIKGAFDAVVSFISDHWQLIVGILLGPIAAAVAIILANWDTIKAGFGAVVDFISSAVGAIVGVLISIFGAVWGTWSALYNAIESGISAVAGAIAGAVGAIIGVLSSVYGAVWGTYAALFGAIESGISGAAGAVSGAVGNMIGALGSIYGAVAGSISAIWEGIKSGVSSAADAVSGAVDRIVGFITGIPSRIGGNFAGIFSGLVSAVESAADSVAGAVDRMKSAINSVPGAGIVKGLVDNIPFLAAGGLITKPTLAVVGEAGPEMVIPLNMFNRTVDPLSSTYAAGMPVPAASSGGGNVVVNAQTNADAWQIASEVRWAQKTAGV